MPSIEVVNNIDHANIYVNTAFTEANSNISWVYPTFIQEFRLVMREYPILFQQTQDGTLTPVVLCGLSAKENVFVSDGEWRARNIPLSAQRLPFSIGFQQSNSTSTPIVTLDTTSPQVNTHGEGQPLFLPHGGNSPYLDQVTDVLEHLHNGLVSSQPFIDKLNDFALIEPVTLSIKRTDGNKQLTGFSTINEDKLSSLSIEELKILHDENYLEAVYLMLASLQNVQVISEKSKRW